ncbi:MAG: hypothetical protein JW749_03495 [Sedimentisphaerales bacterium]|nr:hypothetical protein [Sedimentisphaerales bacterium]
MRISFLRDSNNRGADDEILTTEFMVGFGVISCITQKPVHRQIHYRLGNCRHKAGTIIVWTGADEAGCNQMAGIAADNRKFCPSAITLHMFTLTH